MNLPLNSETGRKTPPQKNNTHVKTSSTLLLQFLFLQTESCQQGCLLIIDYYTDWWAPVWHSDSKHLFGFGDIDLINCTLTVTLCQRRQSQTVDVLCTEALSQSCDIWRPCCSSCWCWRSGFCVRQCYWTSPKWCLLFVSSALWWDAAPCWRNEDTKSWYLLAAMSTHIGISEALKCFLKTSLWKKKHHKLKLWFTQSQIFSSFILYILTVLLPSVTVLNIYYYLKICTEALVAVLLLWGLLFHDF